MDASSVINVMCELCPFDEKSDNSVINVLRPWYDGNQ